MTHSDEQLRVGYGGDTTTNQERDVARLTLKRALRREQRDAIGAVAGLLSGAIRLEDNDGNVLLGDESADGESHTIDDGEVTLGTVTGPPGVDKIASLVAHLYEREVEKRGLAAETLGRYKELSLLYDLSDTLSRVLNVEEVADLVVSEARRFLRATSAALLVREGREQTLRPLAGVGDDDADVDHRTDPVVLKVLESGQARFETAEDAGAISTMCAPLRSGDDVIGVLRVTSDEPTQWTSGDLKLVTSIAANAAAAITHATLHRDRLNEQAMRGQVERFVSPQLTLAASRKASGEAVILLCDLSGLVRSAEPTTRSVTARLERAVAEALALLLEADATVNLPRGEMLVAVFAHDDIETASRSAIASARQILQTIGPHSLHFTPGVAIATTSLDGEKWSEGLGTAAALQTVADGRIVVDESVANSTDEATSCTPLGDVEWPASSTVFEVES